jgi:hypothetical protein
MSHPWLLVLGALRALVEVALLALLAQGLLGLLVGPRRDANLIYQLFCIVTRPAIAVARWLSVRCIVDRHLPLVAFFLLFWLWIGLAYLKKLYCETHLLQCF